MSTNEFSSINPSSPSAQDRKLVSIMHASLLAGIFIPVAGFLIPFVIWLVKKEESPFVLSQGKEIFNFLINLVLALGICGVLSFLLIGIPLFLIISVYSVVTPIIAAIRTSEGTAYRYPWTFRFLS
jgi:uncharacterized Tic20 family protein